MIERIFNKVVKPQNNAEHGTNTTNLNLQVAMHYGIPFTSSILAVDPIQRLLAVGTLDGRIKVIGGNNIEGLFISPKKVPYKYLGFLHNQGFLVGISNENEIQAKMFLQKQRHEHALNVALAIMIMESVQIVMLQIQNGSRY